jgi:hypothetical protein
MPKTHVSSFSLAVSKLLLSFRVHWLLSSLDGDCVAPYSVTAAHVIDLLVKAKVKVRVTLQPTVSRPVCLGFKPHLRQNTNVLLLSDSCRFVHVERRL